MTKILIQSNSTTKAVLTARFIFKAASGARVLRFARRHSDKQPVGSLNHLDITHDKNMAKYPSLRTLSFLSGPAFGNKQISVISITSPFAVIVYKVLVTKTWLYRFANIRRAACACRAFAIRPKIEGPLPETITPFACKALSRCPNNCNDGRNRKTTGSRSLNNRSPTRFRSFRLRQ